MSPVDGRSPVSTGPGAWAVFGWTMITLAAIFAVLMIVFMIVFFSEPGARA